MELNNVSRRTFIKNSAAATAVAVAVPAVMTSRAAAESTSPNDRLRLGFIGVGGRAQTHISSAIDLSNEGNVEIVSVCDVFNRARKETAQKVKRGTKDKPKQVADYRDIINDKSIDAVVHCHARSLARQANDRRTEGRQARVLRKADDAQRRGSARRFVEAWKDSGKVMQVGVQSTSCRFGKIMPTS